MSSDARETGPQPVIQIRGLTKDYRLGFFRQRTVRALDGLNLEVLEGEVFGFLGPNGAGKTTTLKLLMGLIYATSGTATILGNQIADVRTRSQIGYLPENPYFYDYLSGRELLLYCAALFGIPKSAAQTRARALLEAVGLDRDAADRQLRKYSKGMLQRIGIAQALVNDPTIVFLDEPMSGLDPVGRREVRDLLLSLRGRGKTVFFSSHILSDVEAVCDRTAILNKGRLVACGTVDELTRTEDLSLEVSAAGVDPSKFSLPSISSLSRTPNGVRFVLGDETMIDDVIAIIRESGGRLLSINARRSSLEDLFSNRGNEG